MPRFHKLTSGIREPKKRGEMGELRRLMNEALDKREGKKPTSWKAQITQDFNNHKKTK